MSTFTHNLIIPYLLLISTLKKVNPKMHFFNSHIPTFVLQAVVFMILENYKSGTPPAALQTLHYTLKLSGSTE